MHICLASRAFAPRPSPGLCPWITLRTSVPPVPLCSPYLWTLTTALSNSNHNDSNYRKSLKLTKRTSRSKSFVLQSYTNITCITYLWVSLGHVTQRAYRSLPERQLSTYQSSFLFAPSQSCSSLQLDNIHTNTHLFLQGVSIACYAESCISYHRVVRLSVPHTLALSQKDAS